MWLNMKLKRLPLSRDMEFMSGRNELNKRAVLSNPEVWKLKEFRILAFYNTWTLWKMYNYN